MFWEGERKCVYLLYESLYNCKKEFSGEERKEEGRRGEESVNVPAMHHFIINSRVGIKMLTLSDLMDG